MFREAAKLSPVFFLQLMGGVCGPVSYSSTLVLVMHPSSLLQNNSVPWELERILPHT